MIGLIMRVKQKLVALLGADAETVRKVEELDQRHREIGHKLRNIEMRFDPICRMVKAMRNDDGDSNDERPNVH
jgi:hypothetical protein